MLGIEEVLLGACGSRQTLTMTSRVIAWDVLSSGAVHLAGERELPTYLRYVCTVLYRGFGFYEQ